MMAKHKDLQEVSYQVNINLYKNGPMKQEKNEIQNILTKKKFTSSITNIQK